MDLSMSIIEETKKESIKLAINTKLSLYSQEKLSRTYAYAKRIDFYSGAIKPVISNGHELISSRMCSTIADKMSAYAGTNCFGVSITSKNINDESENTLAQSAEDTINEIFDGSNKEEWYLNANECASRLGDGPVTMEDRNGVPYFEAVEKPENITFGWKTDNYHELEWWSYEYGITPEAAKDRFKTTLSVSGDLDPLEQNLSNGVSLKGLFDLAVDVLTQRKDNAPKFVKVTLFNTFIDIRDEAGNVIIPAESLVVLGNGIPFEIYDKKAKKLYHFKGNSFPGLSTGVCDFETVAALVADFDKNISQQADAVAQSVNHTYVTTDSNIEKLKQRLNPNKTQIIKKADPQTTFEVLNKRVNAYDAEPLSKNILNIIRTNSGLQELGQDQIGSNISGKALSQAYQGVLHIVNKKRIRWTSLIKDMVKDALWVFTDGNAEMRKAYFDSEGAFKFNVNVTWNDVMENDKATKIANILNLKNAKVISGYTAMGQADIADPTMEQKRIDLETQKELEFQQQLQGELNQPSTPTGPIMNESMNQPGEGIASGQGNAGSAQTAGMSGQGAANQMINNQ
jgi:hypothetical protein